MNKILPLLAAAALAVAPLAAMAQSNDPHAPLIDNGGRHGVIAVQAGQGKVVDLPGPAANIFVANPKIAEARPASADSLFVFGNAPGRTTLAALDTGGKAIAQFTIVVAPNGFSASEASGAIRSTLPGTHARLRETPAGIALDGLAVTPDQADRAAGAAGAYLPNGQSVQNNLGVRSGVQVSLQVRIAEMARQVTRELGVNWQALGTVGKYSVGFATSNPLLVSQGIATLTNSYVNKGASISNIIDALAQDNLARMLAEPNLTAMSGETASFLVGGEFPIPIAQQNNAITVAFKQFGVALAFVPTVLSSGRINLHVRTEVSALTQAGAVSLGNGNNTISIPALTVRRADTTIELGSGQSFAIAGLLQDQVTQADSGIPWLGEVPVLGALFRSTSFQHNKSELVVIVTPVISRPVDNRADLHMPGDEFQPSTDAERVFQMRQADRREPTPPIAQTSQGFIVQ